MPECLIRLLPHDDHLDTILVQKAATPVAGRSDLLEGVGKIVSQTKPNAVLLEKSSFDDADINAQRVRALHHLAEKLGVEAPQGKPEDSTAAKAKGAADKTTGNGRKCWKCQRPIYGLVYWSSEQQPLHWVCAGFPSLTCFTSVASVVYSFRFH